MPWKKISRMLLSINVLMLKERVNYWKWQVGQVLNGLCFSAASRRLEIVRAGQWIRLYNHLPIAPTGRSKSDAEQLVLYGGYGTHPR